MTPAPSLWAHPSLSNPQAQSPRHCGAEPHAGSYPDSWSLEATSMVKWGLLMPRGVLGGSSLSNRELKEEERPPLLEHAAYVNSTTKVQQQKVKTTS